MAYTSPGEFDKPGKYRIFVDVGSSAKGKRITKSRKVHATSPRDLKKKMREFQIEVDNKYKGDLDYDNVTVEELYEEWMQDVIEKKMAIKTRDNYERHFNKLLPVFGNKKLNSLKKATINKTFTTWEEAGERSLYDRFYALRSLLTYAVKLDIIPYHLMDGLNPPAKNTGETASFYDEAELVKLADALEKDSVLLPKYKVMAKLALSGGLRHGEVKGITMDAINYRAGYVDVNKQLAYDKRTKQYLLAQTKNKEERKVHFSEKVMNEIRNQQKYQMKMKEEMGNLWKGFKTTAGEEVLLLFSNVDGTPNDPSTLNKVWKKFLIRNELRVIRFHDLRHSCATFMLSQGEDFKTIAERLGHKDVRQTMNTYTHVTKEKQKVAAEYFDNIL